MCKVKDCELEDEDNGYCILHCKKDDWYQVIDNYITEGNSIKRYDTSKVKSFWKELRDTLNSGKEIILGYQFNKVIFPEFESNGLSGNDYTTNSFFVDKKDNKFIQEVKFNNCNFDKNSYFNSFEYKRGLSFENCHFFEEVNFEINYITETLFFKNCHFHKKILLSRKYDVPLQFINCYFYDNELDISGKVFKNIFTFKNINVSDKYIRLKVKNTYFNEIVDFSNSKFQTINLDGTTFEKLVLFKDVSVKEELNLETTIFKDEANFLGIKNKDGEKLEPINIKNRETARIIKHSFEKIDNIIEANKFYSLEMQKREDELSSEKVKNWLDLIVFKFHKLSSNHSQDWSLVLLWMINITFVYTVFQFEEVTNSNSLYLYSIVNTGLIIVIIECLAYLEISKSYKGLFFLLFTFINWIIYSLLTNDYSMCFASNIFNPFSIMTDKDGLTLSVLIYKSTIAYLIYQFIISIRQNTRRK